MNWSMRQALPGWLERDELVAHAVGEAKAAKERGVQTLVDLTPVNLGRDVEILREVAEKSGIDLQVEASPRPTGTDANIIQMAREGVATAVLSIPIRYMHSQVETADLRDIEKTIEFAKHFLEELGPVNLTP